MARDLTRIGERAGQMREERFTTLYHYVTDEDHLRACYADLSADRAPGEDGVGKEEYGANLESKLKELSERLGGMGYRPQPVKRVYIPKPGTTKQRPLGMQCFEDKLVQVGLGRVLEQIYEADFVESSFGYRPGRTQHQALDQAQPLKERRTLASGQTETGRASELLRHHGQLGNVQRVQNRGDAAFVPLAEPAKSETELRLGAVQ